MRDQVAELTEMLGFEVNEISLAIAQHLILGYTPKDMADILGIEEAEVTELVATSEFKSLRTHLAFQRAQTDIGVSTDWDEIESMALKNVKTSLEFNVNPDLNIKVAMLANKATRKTKRNENAMHGQSGAIVQLTLTERFITATQQITKDNVKGIHRGDIKVETVEVTKKAEMIQPSLNNLNSFLQPTAEIDRFEVSGNKLAPIPDSMDT